MKIFRYAMMAVLIAGLSGLARASTFQVLDPTGSQPDAPVIHVGDLGNPISFSFYDCTAFNGSGCFTATNGTPNYLSTFSATITFTGAPPADFGCPTTGVGTLDDAFPRIETCNLSTDAITGISTITVDFSGGDVAPGHSIWIVENGISDAAFAPDAGTFTVTAATPEPGSIWLALTGMSSLGYVARRRFKLGRA